MLIYTNESIFEQKTEAIVNPVNCVGVMGKGLALEFKKRFPENFFSYKKACDKGEVYVGKSFFCESIDFSDYRYIVNFPTKQHWKDVSKLSDISIGLNDLKFKINLLKISSISIPKLGCGLGGLNWLDVDILINGFFKENDKTKIIVCI